MIGMAGYGVTNISDRYVLLLLSIIVSSSSRSQAINRKSETKICSGFGSENHHFLCTPQKYLER